jgi:hypothetical protein
MSYEYSKVVYWQVHDTTPTEQSVLAALAFCHNSKTGRCDPSATTIGEMTHFGKSSVRRALDTLKEKNYISWISGGKGKRNESNSNKYTLYLSDQPSHSDTLTLSERGGDPITVIGSPCHSGPQKRIEKESNKKLTNELAGLVGESFEEAAKPRAQEVPSVSPAVSETGVFDKFWSAYPNCIYKKPNAKARCCALYMQLRGSAPDAAAFDEKVLAALEAWRASDGWNVDGGKYISAPLNFFAKRLWEEVPTANCESINPPAEKRNARLESIMKDPAAWALCEERCANLKDGKCAEGQTIPPDKRDWPIPPEQCSHFVSSGE